MIDDRCMTERAASAMLSLASILGLPSILDLDRHALSNAQLWPVKDELIRLTAVAIAFPPRSASRYGSRPR